jgi:glycosyltransferase involved in cell wall biosynthesis
MPISENIILVDFNPTEGKRTWEFSEVIKKTTNREWRVIKCVSNKDRIGLIGNFKRYIKYFVFSFKIFINRNRYENIIAWQQFYGLLFALYCRLFKVKKVNGLMVMTFIYKPKTGLKGRLYHRMMKYIVESKYIDAIVCFSSGECGYYALLFNVAKEKFRFVHLGDTVETNVISGLAYSDDQDYVLSIGFSNRDYNFLIDALKNFQYKVRIYGDKNGNPYPNIELSNEILGKRTGEVISRCKCLVIPLQDINISAGQLTILHAMQIGKPVIVTDSKGIRDFIEDGINGFVIPNEPKLWREKIESLYANDSLYKSMCEKATESYKKCHTISAMAESIGNIMNLVNKEKG